MTTDRGLYIHIPFCIRKCNYCDFCSFPKRTDETVDRYITSLGKEAEAYKQNKKIPISTLYFGGGTPSLLSPMQLERILISLDKVFSFDSDLEFTLEANPGTVTKENLQAYKSLSVNRISMGMQSIHENELKKLGRIHTYSEFLNSYSLLREVGFDNVNIDVMYGIPNQTLESFDKTLSEVMRLNPEHISAYSLIVEPGTPFYKERKTLNVPDEDTECEMYERMINLLREHGYSHYEISNYCKPNHESRHNLKYWRDQEYIGLGVSAYSYYKGRRYGNNRNINEYFENPEPQYKYGEVIDQENEKFEYAMMRLRLKEGFSLSEYKEKFGEDFYLKNENYIRDFEKRGLVKVVGDNFSITEEGFYLSNTILASIL